MKVITVNHKISHPINFQIYVKFAKFYFGDFFPYVIIQSYMSKYINFIAE